MKKIDFAEGLNLPLEAATQTFGIIARKGGGKSYAAGKLVEGLAEHDVQFVVVDPIGVHWGLRLAADGKSPGIDVPVLGGLRGDIPLSPDSGKLMADTVVETGRSFVLDVSQFSLGERKRFLTAFGEQLWQRQKGLHDPQPVHVVLEEGQLVMPQRPMPDENRMLGIWTEIVRLGRNKGIGVSIITQRPQSVAKEALTQVECLVVLQVNGVPEKKALKEWIVEKDLDTNLLEELPSLKQGTAFVWSPQWLEHFGKHKIKEKWTFDSGATPKVGQKRVKAVLKPIDLDALKLQMADTVKKVEENDPAALKKRIRELEAQAKQKPTGVEKTVEKSVVDKRALARLEKLVARTEKLKDRLGKIIDEARDPVRDLYQSIKKVTGAQKSVAFVQHMPAPQQHGVQQVFTLPKGTHPPRERVLRNRIAKQETDGEGLSLSGGVLKILTAVAQHTDGVTREQVSILTGYKRSTRDAYLQRLISAGYVVDPGGIIEATDEGVAALGSNYQPLPTGDALRQHWLTKLPDGERRIFEVVTNAYPGSLSRDVIGESTGYKRSTRDAYLQRLGTRRLVAVDRSTNEVKASEELFA